MNAGNPKKRQEKRGKERGLIGDAHASPTAEKEVDKATRRVHRKQNDGLTHATMDAIQDASDRGQIASGYEGLSVWETVKLFKFNVFTCLLVTFSAATDGY